jgi:hypothetical protein
MPQRKQPARGQQQEPQVGRYRLVAGQHIQADPDWEPDEYAVKQAEATGIAPRAPSRTYNAGDVVESESDLVAKFGANKFQYLGGKGRKDDLGPEGHTMYQQGAKGPRLPGDPAEELEETSTSHAPHGQVSTGKQSATSTAQSTTSGPMGPTDEEGNPVDSKDKVQGQHTVKAGGPATIQHEGQASASHQGGQQQPSQSKQVARAPSKEQYHQQLDKMSVSELRKHADEEEIDLKGARTREEMLKAIKAAE